MYFNKINLNKKQLYCDIDSTINNHSERLTKWRIGNEKPYRINKKAFSNLELYRDQIRFDSLFWIRKFKESNWQIHWITARPKRSFIVTFLWLKKNKFPVDSLTMVSSIYQKPPFLKRLKVDLFVDDLSFSQENDEKIIYNDVIKILNEENIKFKIFENNWEEIYLKYNQNENRNNIL